MASSKGKGSKRKVAPGKVARKKATAPTAPTLEATSASATPVETVLVLRVCAPDMTSRNGFTWPTSGPVSAPDWIPEPECGHGLHRLVGFVLRPGFVELCLLCQRRACCAAFELFVHANGFVIGARRHFIFGLVVELVIAPIFGGVVVAVSTSCEKNSC